MITLGQTLGFPAAVTYLMSIIVPIPFYFLELLVGLLQALVFTAALRRLYPALHDSR